MILARDIIGSKRNTYGRAGDQVKVISEHGTVLIVENEEGIRFPVSEDEMRETETDPKTTAEVPAPAISKKTKSNPTKAPTSLPLTDQTSLF